MRATGAARSSWYYQPVGESAETLELLRLLDEQYTRTPFYGVRRMTAWLQTQGYVVSIKRVRRLLRLLSVEAPAPTLGPGKSDASVRPASIEIPLPEETAHLSQS